MTLAPCRADLPAVSLQNVNPDARNRQFTNYPVMTCRPWGGHAMARFGTTLFDSNPALLYRLAKSGPVRLCLIGVMDGKTAYGI